MRSCTPWKKEQHRSGRQVTTRECRYISGAVNRAEIVQGDNYYTANIYNNGKFVKRLSRNTLAATKAAASRGMRWGG